MDILYLEEIPAKHILQRWTTDAKGIFFLDTSSRTRKTNRLINQLLAGIHPYMFMLWMWFRWMALVEAFKHMLFGLKVLMVSCAPLGEKRGGLGFEDRHVNMLRKVLPANEEVTFVENGGARHGGSVGHSVSVNTLGGMAPPDKERGVVRPANSWEKAPYEGLSKQTRFCDICRREGHKKTTCPDRGEALKQPRKPEKCKNCGMEGHRRNTCTRPLGGDQNKV